MTFSAIQHAARRLAALPTIIFLVLAVGSCSLMGIISPGDTGGGLDLTIETPAALTLVPSISMTPSSYAVAGVGPGGSTFSLSTTRSSVTKSGLTAGTWTVSVNALNGSGVQIAQGSGTVSVPRKGSATLAVTVQPLPGNGSLSVTVTWNAANVPSATVVGQLLPVTGAVIPVSFLMASGTATASASGIPAGYYTLTTQLLSNGINVMGAVDVARIVQGQTTTGSYDFTQAAAAGGTAGGTGSLAVDMTAPDSTALAVSLSGQVPTLSAGSTMTVTASVGNYGGNVTYVWYLNGQSFATGGTASPSLTIGSTLSAGYAYRLDVAAFSADGLRAGSASCAVTVQ